MPTHDFNIANQTFPNFRTDLNNALVALASNSKGSSAPPTLVEGMFWVEDDNPSASVWTLWMYAGAVWRSILQLDSTTGAVTLPSHTHTIANISNAGAMGASIMAAATDADVRTLIDAAKADLATATGITMNTARILGRSTAGVGALEELSAGLGLLLTGGQLTVGSGVVIGRAYTEYTTNAAITTRIPYDNTLPLISEGTQILSVSYTPKVSTSRVCFIVSGFGEIGDTGSGADRSAILALFADSTCLNAAAVMTVRQVSVQSQGFTLAAEFAPGGVSPVTLSARLGADAATGFTLRLNGTASGQAFGGAARTVGIVEEITG